MNYKIKTKDPKAPHLNAMSLAESKVMVQVTFLQIFFFINIPKQIECLHPTKPKINME